jgi:hypothetical protein
LVACFPAGTVSVRSAFIGYKSTQVDGVKVLAGQTGTVDIQLEQTAVEIQEITVVSQTQPLVPRDEVTTKQRIDGSVAEDLPVDRINEVLALQPGVTVDNAGNLSIRGGRNNEAATYVDGVPIQAGYRGDAFVGSAGSAIQISTIGFEEASVTTGSSSAEFGNAKSGIISVSTRTGGAAYAGTLNYETDEPEIKAPHFVYYVKEYLEKKYGAHVAEAGLKVYTTLDLRVQDAAQQVARDRIDELRRQRASTAAIVLMKPGTGESVTYWVMCGASVARCSITCLIRKLPKDTPRSPCRQLLIE